MSRTSTLGAFAAAAGLSLLLLGGCATSPDEDPVMIKMNDLDRRLERLERVLANQSLLELAQQVQTLQSEVRSLRGELEKLQHTSENAKNQQRGLYGDLDKRIQALERGTAVPTVAPGDGGATAPLPLPSGSDRANYQAAFDLLKNGQYEQATAAFQRFLATFPNSTLIDNAQYWLGESYYVTRNYPEALNTFRTVVEKYPNSRKLPDAWLKIGYTQYELKGWGAAREALNKVRHDFPGTPAAEEAGKRLERMTAEGH